MTPGSLKRGKKKTKTRERNRRYTKAGLTWFALNESLAKFTGFKEKPNYNFLLNTGLWDLHKQL